MTKLQNLTGNRRMANVEESSTLDSSNISPHFFSDSESHKQLKKKKKSLIVIYIAITPHSKRKAFEKEANLEQQNQVATCWASFIELYYSDKLEYFSLQPKKNLMMKK